MPSRCLPLTIGNFHQFSYRQVINLYKKSNNVVETPKNTAQIKLNTCMRVHEIIKPKTPEQMRVAALKTAADQASAAVSAERQRQRLTRAKQHMAQLNQTR